MGYAHPFIYRGFDMEEYNDERFCNILKAYVQEFYSDKTVVRLLLPKAWKKYKNSSGFGVRHDFCTDNHLELVAGTRHFEMSGPVFEEIT